jgi:phosphoribosylformimino-5-aminoimidazole carboxamide ribotide isomerase
MIAIPSLDLRNGACVRPPGLSSGASNFALGDPLAVARLWSSMGFHCMQLTDLDSAALCGANATVVEDIGRETGVEFQAGGGVESVEKIERLAVLGASRVLVGPRALNDPDWICEAAELFPGFLIVQTDVRERRVVTRGWVRGLRLDIVGLVEGLYDVPLAGLLVASVACDAQHAAADLALLEELVEISGFPILAAGGATTMDDLRALEHRGVSAVVLGTALYSGTLDHKAVAAEFGC